MTTSQDADALATLKAIAEGVDEGIAATGDQEASPGVLYAGLVSLLHAVRKYAATHDVIVNVRDRE